MTGRESVVAVYRPIANSHGTTRTPGRNPLWVQDCHPQTIRREPCLLNCAGLFESLFHCLKLLRIKCDVARVHPSDEIPRVRRGLVYIVSPKKEMAHRGGRREQCSKTFKMRHDRRNRARRSGLGSLPLRLFLPGNLLEDVARSRSPILFS